MGEFHSIQNRHLRKEISDLKGWLLLATAVAFISTQGLIFYVIKDLIGDC